jgi:hypothetical protein
MPLSFYFIAFFFFFFFFFFSQYFFVIVAKQAKLCVTVTQSVTSDPSVTSSMWVDKFKPVSIKNIIGQQGDRSCAKKLMIWLQQWCKNHLNNAVKKAKPCEYCCATPPLLFTLQMSYLCYLFSIKKKK